ncbi:uncharacterized protein LOC112195713 [Rosa chinensis]|uniref:uncharacterized protein LOC112195713 n=1 Tax=Rosa chinensis TaxID=74649 RepID=UPI001AD8C064|nr:uncharacterized protein LOC112195713 [Rosa chinensis]
MSFHSLFNFWNFRSLVYESEDNSRTGESQSAVADFDNLGALVTSNGFEALALNFDCDSVNSVCHCVLPPTPTPSIFSSNELLDCLTIEELERLARLGPRAQKTLLYNLTGVLSFLFSYYHKAITFNF